jgi:hypothetical protein
MKQKLRFLIVGLLGAAMFLISAPLYAQTCRLATTDLGSTGKYGCTPTKTPAPSGCTNSGNLMICDAIPPGYGPATFKNAAADNFTASPLTVTAGQQVNLNWGTHDSANCDISNFGSIPSTGVAAVSPTRTTTYTLSCRNVDLDNKPTGDLRALASVTVVVKPNPADQPKNTTPTKANELPYTPLEPVPGFNYQTDSKGNYFVTLGNFPDLISSLFKLLFTIGALMAVLRLVIGGIRYMTTGIVDRKKEARDYMTAALYGIGILAASWLILNTINPNLLDFHFPTQNLNGYQQVAGQNVNQPTNNTTQITDTATQNAATKACEDSGRHAHITYDSTLNEYKTVCTF